MNTSYARYKATGRCTRCGQARAPLLMTCERCSQQRLEQKHHWLARHPGYQAQQTQTQRDARIREGFYSDGNKDAKAVKVPMQLVATSRLWKPEMSSGAVLRQLGWEDTTAAVRRLADSAYWAMKDQPDTLAAIIGQFAAARFAPAKK